MPYIPQGRRPALRTQARKLGEAIMSGGELNFVMTELVLACIENAGVSYANMSGVIGDIECMKLELYRRMVAPYEDKKIEENGDVYS